MPLRLPAGTHDDDLLCSSWYDDDRQSDPNPLSGITLSTKRMSRSRETSLNLEGDVNRAIDLLDRLQRTEYNAWIGKDVDVGKLRDLQSVSFALPIPCNDAAVT